MIFNAAHHATPTTCTPQDKQMWFSKWNKDKGKTMKCPGLKFKPQQVNDSSQSNQGTDNLVSQSPLDESIDNKKHKVWRSDPKPHEAQLEDQKTKKRSRRSSRRRENRKSQQMARKVTSQRKE
jgi:hypothetical protein